MKKFFICITIVSLGIITDLLWKSCTALDNGVARTPPMGWMSWQRFRCITDCRKFPNECISENLFKTAADFMVKDGYKDAGYEYIIIDDCWLSKNRTVDGKLQPDSERFPNGIKKLSNYVSKKYTCPRLKTTEVPEIHSRGLKFGIYEDYGNKTCEGYPGILGHMEEDAKLFAEWEVDYVKLDGCYSDIFEMAEGYPEFGRFLNKTGRPMVYSCSLPAYQEGASMKINYQSLSDHCNLWRNYNDIQDSYASMMDIADYFAIKQDFWQPFAKPGSFNDPDMLLIGNYGLSYEQSKTQMAIWAVLAAPLLMSMDFRTIKPEMKEILLNEKIIKINQDELGIQGRRIWRDNRIDVWVRCVLPKINEHHSGAVAFVSRRSDGAPYSYNMTIKRLGLLNPEGYKFYDLYAKHDQALPNIYKPETEIEVRIPPSGTWTNANGVFIYECRDGVCEAGGCNLDFSDMWRKKKY